METVELNISKNLKVKVLVDPNNERIKKVLSKIEQAAKNSKAFSVQFKKKDGTVRDMNCMLGVKKHLKGGTKTLTDNYICAYDLKAKGYRSIDPETVLKVNQKII